MKKISNIGLKVTTAASCVFLSSCSVFQNPSPHIFNNRGGNLPEPTYSSNRVKVGDYQAPVVNQTQPEINVGAGDIIETEVPIIETNVEPEIVIPEIPKIVYTVKRNDSLWSIAHSHGVTVKELARVNGLNEKSMLKIKQKLELPAGARFIAKAQRPAVKTATFSGDSQKYKVKAGDSISVIAWKFKVSQKNLRSVNSLKSDKLRIGQTLIIPTKNAPRTRPSTRKPVLASFTKGGTYTVKSGDSLSVIAHKHKIKTSTLMKANNLSFSSVLQVGKKLVIPGGNTLNSLQNKPAVKKAIELPEQEPVIANNPLKVIAEDNLFVENTTEDSVGSETETNEVVNSNTLPEGFTHVEAMVVENDTLESLAVFYNSTVRHIKEANPTVSNNEDLKPGIILKIPRKK